MNDDEGFPPWPADLAHHLAEPTGYSAGYAAHHHPDFRDPTDDSYVREYEDLENSYHAAGGTGPDFEEGVLDAANGISHKLDDPDEYHAYHAEEQAWRKRNRDSVNRQKQDEHNRLRERGDIVDFDIHEGPEWSQMPDVRKFDYSPRYSPWKSTEHPEGSWEGCPTCNQGYGPEPLHYTDPDETQDPFDPRLIGAALRRTAGLECQHCGKPITETVHGDWLHADPADDHDPASDYPDAEPGYYDHEKGQRSPHQEREDVLRDKDFKAWAKTLDKKTRGYFGQMTMEDLLDAWHRATGQKPAFTHPESHLFPDRDGQPWKLVDRATGHEYHPGDELTDFRGDTHIYHGVDSFPGRGGDNPASEGRILVHAPQYRPGPHWFNSPRTLYPSVFDADIVPHTDWSPDDQQDPFDPRLIGAGLHRRLAATAQPVNPGVLGRIAAELSPPCPDCGQVAGFDEHPVSPRIRVCRNCEYPMTDIGHDHLLERTLGDHARAVSDLPETDHPTLGKHGQRLAGDGMSWEDTMAYIDQVLAEGEHEHGEPEHDHSMAYHNPDCAGWPTCSGCGYLNADGEWRDGPTPPEDAPFQDSRANGHTARLGGVIEFPIDYTH